MHIAGIKKTSAWNFQTSNTGALGLGIAAVEGGHIYLTDPQDRWVSFRFGAVGAGVFWGTQLPKIPKVQFRGKSLNPVVAPAFFPNWGTIYILDTFKGDELERSDITGACMFVEAGIGAIGAYSVDAIVLGMSPGLVAATLAGGAGMGSAAIGSIASSRMIESATAVLVMRGFGVGLVAGFGAGAFVGGLM